MSDDSESFETRSSGDLWSEICSDLPEPLDQGAADELFTDSFQPQGPVSNQSNFTSPSNLTSSSQWEPMADSAVYIASLGMGGFFFNWHTLMLIDFILKMVYRDL